MKNQATSFDDQNEDNGMAAVDGQKDWQEKAQDQIELEDE